MIHRCIIAFLAFLAADLFLVSSAWSPRGTGTSSRFGHFKIMAKSGSKEIDTEEREQELTDAISVAPRWCPEQQIYIGGVVPDNADVGRLLSDNDGHLRIFGYGSLCWNPGQGATLSRAEDGVTQTLGRAVGWKRCWAQRSADHRGTPSFQGLVCTLLTDEEVSTIHRQVEGYSEVDEEKDAVASLTEGVIYTVPPHLVDDCLAELDFREKGGYERDVIDVIEDDTSNTVQALLYRGTPANPAFWARALLDLRFAAAVMTVAVGPSGPNSEYLFNLDRFLADSSASSPAAAAAFEDHTGDSDTMELASMARSYADETLYFMFGCGSNQHGQLLLAKAAGLVNGDEAHDLKEIVLLVPSERLNSTEKGADAKPIQLYCGGGHSALLTDVGSLHLWGWNEQGQLGKRKDNTSDKTPYTVIDALRDIRVEKASLGHSHTLLIEQGSGALYSFGDNSRGQVDGKGVDHAISNPTRPKFAQDGERFIDVAAGLFHSAAITSEGELLTFGCRRFGQCVHHGEEDHLKVAVGRWRTEDESRLVKVACGHRHTVVLDEHGRVYTMGNNKYGQLGVKDASKKGSAFVVPSLVDGPLGKKGSGCINIDCGWSHNFALVKNEEGATVLYGWGRNDKGQLATCTYENIVEPQLLHHDICGRPIGSFSCGSESTMVLDKDGKVWGTGWNEHGNIGTGDKIDVCEFTEISGSRITAPPPSHGQGRILIAAGGAHFLAMKA